MPRPTMLDEAVVDPPHLQSPVPRAEPPLASPRVRHQRSNTDPNCIRPNLRRDLYSLNSVLSPRPYESLFAERAYLTASLETLSAKRSDLMIEYCSVQEQSEHTETPKQRRRLRKRMSLLKSKIGEAAEQQKTLFVRLGELFVELQSREVLGNARQHMDLQQAVISDTASSYCSGSPSHASFDHSEPSTPQNLAAFSDGSPADYFADSYNVPPPAPTPPDRAGALGSRVILATVDESDEYFSSNHGLDYAYKEYEDECAIERPMLRRRTSYDGDLKSLKDKRLSLPSLQSLWPND